MKSFQLALLATACFALAPITSGATSASYSISPQIIPGRYIIAVGGSSSTLSKRASEVCWRNSTRQDELKEADDLRAGDFNLGHAISGVISKLNSKGINVETKKVFQSPGVLTGASISVPESTTAADLLAIPGVTHVWPVRNIPHPHSFTSAPRGIVGVENEKVVRRHLLQRRANNDFENGQFPPHQMTGVDKLHAKGYLGAGIRILVIDTGVDYKNPILGGWFGKGCKVGFGHSFVTDKGTPTSKPDPYTNCSSHGTHVSGTIGANQNKYGFTGVAPKATLGMYRIFPCSGPTPDDVTVESLLRAMEDDVDVINMSLGSPSGWMGVSSVEHVVQKLIAKGIHVVTSAGNDQSEGMFYANSPTASQDGISTASVEVTVVPAYNMVFNTRGYPSMSLFSARLLGVDHPMPLYITSTDLNVDNDACEPLPKSTSSLRNHVVGVRRGTCYSSTKLKKLAAKGARYVIVYGAEGAENDPYFTADGTGLKAVGGMTRADGVKLIKYYLTQEKKGGLQVTLPSNSKQLRVEQTLSSGEVSEFSQFGPTNDLYGQPSLAVPGGGLYFDGLSVRCGLCALILAARKKDNFTPIEMRQLLSSTSKSIPVKRGTKSPLTTVVLQGGGLIQVDKAFEAKSYFSPNELYLNDMAHFAATQTVTITNKNSKAVTYRYSDTGAQPRLVYDKKGQYSPSLSPVTILPGKTSTFQIKFQPPQFSAGQRSLFPVYSGFIMITADNKESFQIPYFGFAGNMGDMQILDQTDRFAGQTEKGLRYPFIMGDDKTPQLSPTTVKTYKMESGIAINFRLAQACRAFSIDLVFANTTFKPTISPENNADLSRRSLEDGDLDLDQGFLETNNPLEDSHLAPRFLANTLFCARAYLCLCSLLKQVMSSTGESDFPNGSGNCLYLKDTQGYKSWSQRAFINLRADKVWDVVNQSIDSLVTDYRSTLVIAHATASVAPVEPASSGFSGLGGDSGSAHSDASPRLTSVQVADKVAKYRERAIRRNDLACKYIANSISEEQMSHLIHLTSAYEMWDTLRAQPYSGDIPFKEFVNKVKIAMTDFQNLGAPLPHWLFAGMLVRSLPAQYDSIVGNLASDIDIHMDWNTFYPKLLMNVEMADSRNKQKKSLSARIVDDTSLVARISTTAQKDYSKSYCSRCKALGHERGWRLCPSRNKDASAPASSDSNSNVAAIGVDESALMTYTFPYSRTMPRFPWIIDSGAKVHCVGDKSVLSDVVSEPLKIYVADQSQIESPGHGSVTFLTSYGARITIKRVYYMPGAQCGFISIDRLLESMTRFCARFLVRGFVMDAAPVQPIMSSSPPSMVGANRLTGTCTLMEAHRKLGHQSPAAIVLAVKSGAITGITLKDEKVTPCFSCIQAKSKRSPFSNKSTEAPHALYRVFIDLGFVEHPNHHGDTIYLAIVDQYSTAKWTIVLKDKRAECSRATSCLSPRIQGKTAIEVLLGKKPSLAHLQPFGSTAFVHVPKERRSKLAPRSIQGVFIGYSGEYNYRVWVQSSKQVYVSRHVTFLETPSVVTSSQDRADASDPVHHSQPPHPPPDVLPSTPTSPVVDPTLPDPQPPPVVPIGVGQQGGYLAVVPRKDDNNDNNDEPDNYHDTEEPLDGEAEVALAPREGYAIVRTGPNPGQFENVDPSNILPAGSRRRPQPPENILPIISAIMVNVSDTPPMFHDKLSYDAYCAAMFAEEDIEIPKTFKEAMKSPYRNHWSAAMVSELLQFDHHGVFQEVKWHKGIRVLGTIWVYSIKRNANGKIIRFKARLVAQGFAQRPGIDYHDTYAPVARSSTILFLIALAVAQGLYLEQFNFDCAFLNGKMTEDVYV
ncbi:BQ5605_C035g11433 [Microbotryum silenes-dioicae]|uniref:BQ5605_C035g11433 protein n=1 Tax=Microbotryum silenes-dioicae TaxID=796604 RepID=A0A2X0MJW8_9BASI|nr:BQ5605_C035g11433 [Microbotryum silenes-dioicae]